MKAPNVIKNQIEKWIRYSSALKRVKDDTIALSAEVKQLRDALKLYHNMIVPPPGHLQTRVARGVYENFVTSGFENVSDIEKALTMIDLNFNDFKNVLDFGCGCARVLLAAKKKYPGLNMVGIDIDAETIEHCKAFYDMCGDFYKISDLPPLDFPDQHFQLVYGISVFTHLPEEYQFEWLKELKRITSKSGILLLTVENQKTAGILTGEERSHLQNDGIIYKKIETTQGLPDYYQTTLHTHDYIFSEWSRFFEIMHIIPLGMSNHQDIVVCKNTGSN